MERDGGVRKSGPIKSREMLANIIYLGSIGVSRISPDDPTEGVGLIGQKSR
jgi:hypothetical protein